MITIGAKPLVAEQTSDNRVKPLLLEQTSDYQRGKVFTGGAKKLLPTEQKLYWRSRKVIINGAKPLLAEQTCYNQ